MAGPQHFIERFASRKRQRPCCRCRCLLARAMLCNACGTFRFQDCQDVDWRDRVRATLRPRVSVIESHCRFMTTMDFNIESEDFESGEIARAYAVQEALQTAFDSAYQQADEQQLHADVISYTVDSCMQSCVSLLEMTFVSREIQPLDPDPLTETSWQPDPEAQPCAPDTWMRGVIQVRQPQRQPSVSTTGAYIWFIASLAKRYLSAPA